LNSETTETAGVASVKAEFNIAKKALEKYERILGPNPEAAEDVRQLGEKLRLAEEEKSSLKLQLHEAEEVRFSPSCGGVS